MNNDVTFELLVDEVSYKGRPKPDGAECGRIQRRLRRPEAHRVVGVEELGRLIEDGHAIMPGICVGGTRLENWVAQQLFFVDFDNDDKTLSRGYWPIDAVSALNRARWLGLAPLYIYETAQSGNAPCEQRFRMVFGLDAPTTDAAEADRILTLLMRAFPEADPSGFNRVHLFLSPGREVWPCWT